MTDETLRETLSLAFDTEPAPAEAEPPPPPPQDDPPLEPAAPGAAAEPAEAPAIPPPASWSAAAKADFSQLPPHIRQEVRKREEDFEKGLAQQQSRAARLNRLDAVLGPRTERFRLSGLDEAQALQMLFAAQDYLERDPINALLYLGRQSGVDFRALAAALGTTQAPGAPQPLAPELQRLAAQVQTLTQAVDAQHVASEEAQREAYLGEIERFASGPGHVYFDNVSGRMAELIRTGQAAGLDEAYEQACWSDREIRPLMLRAEAEAQAQAQHARAAAARHASGSVTGSPSPGARPDASPKPTLRGELEAAFDALA